MITIKQRPASTSGISRLIGARTAVSLPPTLDKLVYATPKAKPKRTQTTHGDELTTGMRRIYEQYRAGTYDTNDYSQRSCQRHRKYFLSMGIDLRKPYSPSATVRVSMPKPLAKQRAKSVPNKKKKMKLQPAPEHASETSDPACRKSKCASDALDRSMHRARVQPRRTGITTGLGALARRAG